LYSSDRQRASIEARDLYVSTIDDYVVEGDID
jgi:hypothetical protein